MGTTLEHPAEKIARLEAQVAGLNHVIDGLFDDLVRARHDVQGMKINLNSLKHENEQLKEDVELLRFADKVVVASRKHAEHRDTGFTLDIEDEHEQAGPYPFDSIR